jgi:ABC-2 type transport system ATP-binding protein
MLRAVNLLKRFGDRVAVDGVSFDVKRGTTLGLLGPNGAGKTTTLALLTGLFSPDSGEVLFDGIPLGANLDAQKSRIGLVPQDLALYDELSAWANLELFGGLYGLKGADLKARAEDALTLVGLADRASEHVATYSGGMKRRLNIAGALLHDPELILLDEPTVGVDPQSRNAIFDNLEELRRRGKTLIYTTHYMEEAERLCDRVVIVDHGRVIADDDLPGLYRLLPDSNDVAIEFAGELPEDLVTQVSSVAGVSAVRLDGHLLKLGVADFGVCLARVLDLVTARGLAISALRCKQASLENVFLSLTGRDLRDSAKEGPALS